MIIKIKPNTNRLRQLCRDHGKLWVQNGQPWGMPCFNGETGVSITSQDGTHTRNVPISIIKD